MLIKIYPHTEEQNNFLLFIDSVIALAANKNAGEPLHQAILAGQLPLVLHLLGVGAQPIDSNINARDLLTEAKNLLRNDFFDIDRRDIKGRTLISLALNSKNKVLLAHLLAHNPNIHAPT
jgi:ankyrin repeat protein